MHGGTLLSSICFLFLLPFSVKIGFCVRKNDGLSLYKLPTIFLLLQMGIIYIVLASHNHAHPSWCLRIHLSSTHSFEKWWIWNSLETPLAFRHANPSLIPKKKALFCKFLNDYSLLQKHVQIDKQIKVIACTNKIGSTETFLM